MFVDLARFVSQVFGLCEIGVGFAFLVFLQVRPAPSMESAPVSRIDLNRLCKIGDRFVVVSLLAVGAATVVVRLGIFRVESEWPR